jgi:internalin A
MGTTGGCSARALNSGHLATAGLQACTVVLVAVAPFLSGCSTQDVPLNSDHASPGCTGIIEFRDRNLETAVRAAIDKPDGSIRYGDVADLEELSASGYEITDVEGVQCLTSLSDLDLRQNEITALGPLGELTSLNHLALGDNQIEDLSPLASLRVLFRLDLSNNPITDLSPLADLSGSLMYLDLTGVCVTDVSALLALDWLSVLGLSCIDPADLELLVMHGLEQVWLNSFTAGDLTIAGGQITSVGMQESVVSRLTLQDLSAFTNLDLVGNVVGDLTLDRLESLTNLALSGNAITDLNSLVQLDAPDTAGTLEITDNPFDCADQAENLQTLAARWNLRSDCE